MNNEERKRIEKLGKNTPDAVAKEISTYLGRGGRKVYEELNKMPFLVGEYRGAMMKAFREKFVEQLKDAIKEDKAFCAKTGRISPMEGSLLNDVIGMVERSKTLFEIEALARFVFDENEVPNMYMVQQRAKLLENAFAFTLKN